jgi:hypothetical protein
VPDLSHHSTHSLAAFFDITVYCGSAQSLAPWNLLHNLVILISAKALSENLIFWDETRVEVQELNVCFLRKMDPISAAGIALSVASLAGQVFTGCIQG